MSNKVAQSYFIGVDVGSGTVRSVVIDDKGSLCGSAIEILVRNDPLKNYFEQSSDQIWDATCKSIRQVLKKCHLNSDEISGIGFDATCSLVVLDDNGLSLSVCPTDSNKHFTWNVIMWMDHRAQKQADEINACKHSCLKSVGDKISLEMEPPKILWLKENMPETYQKAGHFMDLADFLTYKATGSLSRSSCCVVCKWMYQASNEWDSWDPSFYEQIGLSDLCENDFRKIGSHITNPGTPCGSGLNPKSAEALGLKPGIPVATGIIDAHAGCLGMMFTKVDDKNINNLLASSKLSMICGTSTCHMALSLEALYVGGVWGPYFGAILPNYWTNEAGQSAVGPVLDTVVKQFCTSLQTSRAETTSELHTLVRQKLQDYETKHGHLVVTQLTKDIHVWPDYHGNRSPLAEPQLTGAILGLRVESDQARTGTESDEDLYLYAMSIYLAHIHSLALMTRFIKETLISKGHKFEAIYLCGGLQKNSLYVQAHADICQLPVVVPDDAEPVARGAAVLGAFASGKFESLEEAAKTLSSHGTVIHPRLDTKEFFDRKYLIFRKLGDFMLQTIN